MKTHQDRDNLGSTVPYHQGGPQQCQTVSCCEVHNTAVKEPPDVTAYRFCSSYLWQNAFPILHGRRTWNGNGNAMAATWCEFFCRKLLAAEIDPEAKARASGSERETGWARVRFFLWVSDNISQRVEERIQKCVWTWSNSSPFSLRLTDEKYCIFFSPKAFCNTQKVLQRPLQLGLCPGLGWGSSGHVPYPLVDWEGGHLPNSHLLDAFGVSILATLVPHFIEPPSIFSAYGPARRSSIAPYRLNNLWCMHDNLGKFFPL